MATERYLVHQSPKLSVRHWLEGLAKWVNVFTNLRNLQFPVHGSLTWYLLFQTGFQRLRVLGGFEIQLVTCGSDLPGAGQLAGLISRADSLSLCTILTDFR